MLVNDAGGVAGQEHTPVEDVSDEDWNVIFDINVNAAFTLCRAAAPGMKRAGGGRIVNISSGAGLQPSLTGVQAYCSAKHAVVGLTRQLAHELGRFNITVNSVAPGFIRTNAATERQWDSYGPDGQKALVQRIAMQRLGHRAGYRQCGGVLRLRSGGVRQRPDPAGRWGAIGQMPLADGKKRCRAPKRDGSDVLPRPRRNRPLPLSLRPPRGIARSEATKQSSAKGARSFECPSREIGSSFRASQ